MKKLFCMICALAAAVSLCAKGRLEILPEIKYSNSPAIIKGMVKGYKQSAEGETVMFTYSQFVASQKDTAFAKIADDGSFKTEINICYTDRVRMIFRGKSFIFEALPGEETGITIDPSQADDPKAKKPVYEFSGTIGDFNTDLVRYGGEYDSQKWVAGAVSGESRNRIAGMDYAAYKKYLLDYYEEGAKKVDADKRLCGAFKSYVKASYKYQMMVQFLLAKSMLTRGNEGKDMPVPDGYYDFLVDWSPYSQIPVYYTENTVSVAPTANYIANYMGIKLAHHPSAEELLVAYQVVDKVADLNVLSDDEVADLKKKCPVLSSKVLYYNKMAQDKLDEAKNNPQFVVKSISPDLEGEDVFKAIIADYKGKPLLVDFWATWCGPCKAAMKTILPVKEALKGKTNFVYVTSPTSPEATWKKEIIDIHGDHYYVTAKQWETLLKQFETNGIPTYVIVDKDGNIKTHYVGYPGNDVMMEQLK